MLDILAAWMRSQPSISSLVENRIYVRQAFEKSKFPRVVIKQAGQTFGMVQSGPDGLDRPFVTVECYGVGSDQGKQASQVADAVVTVLHGFKGVIAGVDVQGVFALSRTDAVERRNDAGEEMVFQVAVTFKVVAVSI